jgi:alkylhydroperoxidase family enzyme
VVQVAGREPATSLPERYKLVVRYTDALVGDPNSVTDELRAELAREFTPAQIVELTATVAFASAFSKAAIAWGPPPEMPVTEVPSPGPGRNVADV